MKNYGSKRTNDDETERERLNNRKSLIVNCVRLPSPPLFTCPNEI